MGNPNLVAIINNKIAFIISGDEYNSGSGWTQVDIAIDLYKKYISKFIAIADKPEEIDQTIYKIEFVELFN